MLAGRIKQKQHFKMFNQLHGEQTLLTSWQFPRLLNKFSAFRGTWRFIHKSLPQPSLSSARPIQSTISHPVPVNITLQPTPRPSTRFLPYGVQPSNSSIRHSRNWVSLFLCCSTQVLGLSESLHYVAECRWVESKCRTFCHEDGGSRSLQLQQLRPASGALSSSQVAILLGLFEPHGSTIIRNAGQCLSNDTSSSPLLMLQNHHRNGHLSVFMTSPN